MYRIIIITLLFVGVVNPTMANEANAVSADSNATYLHASQTSSAVTPKGKKRLRIKKKLKKVWY